MESIYLFESRVDLKPVLAHLAAGASTQLDSASLGDPNRFLRVQERYQKRKSIRTVTIVALEVIFFTSM